MGIWQREHRQEGKGLSTSVTATASDPNPIVMFIVSLLAAATMPDDRLALANRALPQDDLGASSVPIDSQIVPAGGKWDNKNRGNGALPGSVTCQVSSTPKRSPSPPQGEIFQLEKE